MSSRSDYTRTNLKHPEKGYEYCGACAKPAIRKHLTQRHFKQCKQLKEPRSLLQIGEKPYGEPWKKDWKSFLPAQYANMVDEQDNAQASPRAEPSMNIEDLSDNDSFQLNQSIYGQSQKKAKRAEEPSSSLHVQVEEMKGGLEEEMGKFHNYFNA